MAKPEIEGDPLTYLPAETLPAELQALREGRVVRLEIVGHLERQEDGRLMVAVTRIVVQ